MTDLPLCLNTPWQSSPGDEHALTHTGLPCVCLGGNSLNVLQSSRLKKAMKRWKRNEYHKTKNFSPSFLYASKGNRNHRPCVKKKNRIFFSAGSFSSLLSHLRYNPPVRRIFWLSALKDNPHLPIIQYWFKLLGFLSFWPPVFYDVFKTLWLLWTI